MNGVPTKLVVSMLIRVLNQATDMPPNQDYVKNKAQETANLLGYLGDIEPIVAQAMSAITTSMGVGVSLIDKHVEHNSKWIIMRPRQISWIYSDAYKELLANEGWGNNTVQSLNDATKKILSYLQDPTSEGSWDRRGLVIGHVQSGKTANYIGLVSKAADAGYKCIIVITGLHNNLRRQTQERIDKGFIGRSSDNHRCPMGVGGNEISPQNNYPHPITLTTIHNDFKTETARNAGWELNDFSKPIIFVIKKNVRTLQALHRWLQTMNARGGDQIADVPMLMIDDEADYASINTNQPDLDPTQTNSMIRKILKLFNKSGYIGYTATPFANIFINPDDYHEETYEELFPRHFIYCLDAPSSYLGPEQMFLEESSDDDSKNMFLCPIDDCEDFLPISHKIDHPLADQLPSSLRKAINQFILARAIRNLRGQHTQHCSMMINISRFITIQNKIKTIISSYKEQLKTAVQSNYAMDEGISNQNTYMKNLKKVFEDAYEACGFSWLDVKQELHNACSSVELSTINSQSEDALNYDQYEQENMGKTVIAIGGLSLSRGITIEGLCISYMYRNTKMYDTLMQMGRWFGYRPNYEDLCRVYLMPDSISWYAHIAEASDDLRRQIKKMSREQLTPKKFGLYVKAHPNRLLITARNKMRDGEEMIMKQNLSGKLRETFILPKSYDINLANEELISDFCNRKFEAENIKNTEKGWMINDVPIDIFKKFLIKFQNHTDFEPQKEAIISYLDKISERHPNGDVLLISSGSNENNGYRLNPQTRKTARDYGDDGWRVSKDRVASKGDEKHGLDSDQIMAAQQLAVNDDGEYPKNISDRYYRQIRKKPLLMVHILNTKDENRIPAFGISFPFGDEDIEVEIKIVANRVLIRNLYGEQDGAEDDQDYDDD